jgi:ligand-binding sensor domain-containing protein
VVKGLASTRTVGGAIIASARLADILVATGILALSLPSHAQSRPLRFGHLSVEDGLSHTWVRSIVKDNQGFLWIGTAGGLNRYDGSRFVAYHHDPKDPGSLAGEVASTLFEDSHKRLWVGAGGLNLYDRDRDRFERHPLRRASNAQSDLVVRRISEDRQGRLWIGTGEGLFRYDPETKISKLYGHDPRQAGSLSYDNAVGLLCDRRGRVWVGSDGLDRYDEQTDTFVHVLEGPGGPRQLRRNANVGTLYIHSMYEAQDGALWLGSLGEGLGDGLIRFDPETGAARHYHFDPADPNSVAGDRIAAITGDQGGLIYVSVENQGLDVLDTRTGKFTHYRPDPEDPSSLASVSIWSLLLDDQGILWLGTYNAGVQFVSPFGQRFGLLRAHRGGLSDPHVTAVIEDHLGDLWIGTDGGGLNHLDRKTGRFTCYRHDPSDPNSLGSDAVLALLEDRQQNIWIGTWAGGLHRLDPRSGRIERFPRGPDLPPSLAEWTIVEDAQGNLLLGRYGPGVEVFDPKTRQYTPLSRVFPGLLQTGGFQQGSVYAVAEDGRGRLWLGGTEGLDVVDRKSGHVEHHPIELDNPQSLVPGAVFAIRPDSRGNVWIGTEHGGLTCLDAGGQRVRQYTQTDGLPHKDVGDILEDDEGNLWLGTPHGLVKFENGVSLPEKPRFVVFDVHDGLQGYEFRHGAAFKSRTGEMFFGGQLGLNYFWPRDVRQNPMVPPVVLTDFRIFNKSVEIGTPHSPLKKAITQTSELTLSYRQSVVAFEFAALNFILPQKNRYKYKLEGFDRDWNEVGTQHAATYMNLPQGRYTFRVKASNNDGVWNEEGASLQLLVTPPFWKTWWFTAALALVLVASAVGSYRFRVRQHVRAERELKARVAAAMADIKTLHGLLPICAWCKKVRDDGGYWNQLEEYVSDHTQAEFSHGICPECREKHYQSLAGDPTKN